LQIKIIAYDDVGFVRMLSKIVFLSICGLFVFANGILVEVPPFHAEVEKCIRQEFPPDTLINGRVRVEVQNPQWSVNFRVRY
jgi:hypothetical protein